MRDVEKRSQVDLMSYLNLISEFVLYLKINWYVGIRKCLNSYVSRVIDRERKSTLPIPLGINRNQIFENFV